LSLGRCGPSDPTTRNYDDILDFDIFEDVEVYTVASLGICGGQVASEPEPDWGAVFKAKGQSLL
jgi:hypothetical protein